MLRAHEDSRIYAAGDSGTQVELYVTDAAGLCQNECADQEWRQLGMYPWSEAPYCQRLHTPAGTSTGGEGLQSGMTRCIDDRFLRAAVAHIPLSMCDQRPRAGTDDSHSPGAACEPGQRCGSFAQLVRILPRQLPFLLLLIITVGVIITDGAASDLNVQPCMAGFAHDPRPSLVDQRQRGLPAEHRKARARGIQHTPDAIQAIIKRQHTSCPPLSEMRIALMFGWVREKFSRQFGQAHGDMRTLESSKYQARADNTLHIASPLQAVRWTG